MNTSVDIFAIAAVMIGKHGETAADQAVALAAKLHARGDVKSGETWLKVVHMIHVMESREPPRPNQNTEHLPRR